MNSKYVSILLALAVGLGSVTVRAGDGSIHLLNRDVSPSNGDAAYNVPIWVDLNSNGVRDANEGIGTVAAAMGTTATLGLFVQGASAPFATAGFRADINGAFLGSPSSQSAIVPGFNAGDRAPLTIKVWTGLSFDASPYRGQWNFTSEPLGGITDGGAIVFPPDITWGDPSGVGYAVNSLVVPGPNTGVDQLVRQTAQDAVITFAALLANDSDPNGGTVTVSSVSTLSAAGAAITVAGDVITYHQNGALADEFYYFVRNTAGGLARGAVKVVINDPEGLIYFSNRSVPILAGATYDVPIYVDANFDGARDASEGFGYFASTYYAKAANLGLFLRGASSPLAVIPFATSSTLGAFLAFPESQLLGVPGSLPGGVADFTIKAWMGESFETSPLKGSWDFTSQPLGGSILGGANFPLIGVEGWGNTNGAGFAIEAGPKPIVGSDEVTRPYRKDLTIQVSSLLANDADPEGSVVTFVAADSVSNGGASITFAGGALTYHHTTENADFFFYSVRSAHGVVSKGRVDVKVGPADGDIRLSNREIPLASGAGTYDVPIWVDENFDGVRQANEGIGTFANHQLGTTATLGLFLQGAATPLATFDFATDSTGAFIPATNDVVVTIAGSAPGALVPLTIKVWTGADYDTAAFKRSWDIVSPPLGGPRAGAETIPTPSLAAWGPENGDGFMFSLGDKPAIGSDLVIRGTGEDAIVTIGTLLGNDIDPNGGTILFTGIDPISANGIPITFFGTTIVYSGFGLGNDSFNYSVQLSSGGVATGHVDVVVDDADGSVYFSNRLVRKSAGGGVYNIPVWVDKNFNGRRDGGEGIGDFAQQQFGTNATFGLFLRDGTSPLATANFAPGHGSAFLADPAFQTVKIPSIRPGSSAALTAKIWVGGTLDSATIKGSWDFASLPLGGGKAGVGVFEIPDLSGLADEDSSEGLKIVPGVKPVTYGRVLTRGVGQNVTTLLSAMMANDSDPEGGALTLVGVDELSANGAVLTVLGNTLYYLHAIEDSDAPDVFEYTVRNAKGGIAKGRVDVVVTDGSGVFKTRLAIESGADGAHIRFRGVAGAHYSVQARDTVEAPWQDLGEAASLGFGMFEVIDPTAGAARFYRVLAQP